MGSKKAGKPTRFERLCQHIRKDMERLGKKAVSYAARLGYDVTDRETSAVIRFALDMGLQIEMEIMKRRCMATEREFGKHAIRRALQGKLKTAKPIWVLCKPLRKRG